MMGHQAHVSIFLRIKGLSYNSAYDTAAEKNFPLTATAAAMRGMRQPTALIFQFDLIALREVEVIRCKCG